jgi:glycosyltransferase involved in cell wall biosynthesis
MRYVCPVVTFVLDLLVCVVSHDRADLLDRTLTSIATQAKGLRWALHIVDNASQPETLNVIAKHCPTRALLLQRNDGINTALNALLPPSPISPFTLVSENDVEYRVPFSVGIGFLKDRGEDLVSYQHSPEHGTCEIVDYDGYKFHRKVSERGQGLLFTSEYLWSLRPFPEHERYGFDWWVCRNAPKARSRVFSLYGGAIHIGQHRSSWYPGGSYFEYPEFTIPKE